MPIDSQRIENPFIPISKFVRTALIGYFLVFILLQKVLIILLQDNISLIIYFLDILYYSFLFIPIFFYKPRYGWLHPLIFPVLFSLSKSIFADPVSLFNLFFIDQNNSSFEISHILLSDLSDSELRYVHIKGQVMNIIALISYYFSFFYFSGIRPKIFEFSEPRNFKTKLFFLYALSITIFLVYVQLKGGINAHILSWASGRFKALSGDGPVFVVAKIAAIASLIWFTFDFHKAKRSPIFWFMALTSIPIQFLLTGSRSVVIFIAIWFLLIYMIQSNKIPKMQLILAAIAAAAIISTLGLIRNSAYQGEVAWNKTINEFELGDAINQTQEELDKRKGEENGYLPVMAMVPDEVGYLYGESYLGAVFFFIPRYFWPGKPRGAGALVGELIFGRNSGAGVPPSPVGEVYWNFGVIGVVLIFVLFGRIHKSLEISFIANYKHRAFQIIYVITLFMLTPATIKIVSYFQTIIPVVLILWWIGAVSFGKEKKLTA